MNFRFYSNSDWSLSVSESTHPLFNLAWEGHLLKDHFESSHHLFLYRNSPCIVSGRFQIPWKEINFKKTNLESIPYVRRRSGGGTVYHDHGNWNFCIISKGRSLRREENLSLICDVLKDLGVIVRPNERFDLVYVGGQGQVKKVSGSAFKQTKDMSLHHGTLLMEAQLSDLKGSLGTTQGWQIEGKGINSVPSPVTNLFDHFSPFSFDEWCEAWRNKLTPHSACEELGASELSDVIEEANALDDWSWRWGETPHHKVYWEESWVEIKKGIVAKHKLANSQLDLTGQKVCSFGRDELALLLKDCEPFEREQLEYLLSDKKRLLLI